MFKVLVNELRDKYEPFHLGKLSWSETTELGTQNLVFPPWLCQPYVRMQPEEHLKKMVENKSDERKVEKRHYEDVDGNPISRKKMKKLRRIGRRPEKPEGVVCSKSLSLCSATDCDNPLVGKMMSYSSYLCFFLTRVPNVSTSFARNAAETNVSQKIWIALDTEFWSRRDARWPSITPIKRRTSSLCFKQWMWKYEYIF